MCAGITAASIFMFSSWWYNNAVCGRNLCKLFTINLKGSGGCLSMNRNDIFGVFFFPPSGFLYFFFWVGVGGIEDVRHDVLCLNVFECLFFIQKCM